MKILSKIKDKYISLPIAVKATFWFIVCSTLQKTISIITTPIFTRLLTTEQYGTYSVYNSWLYVFTIFTAFRLDCGVFNKAMSKFKDDRDGYTASMQGTTVLITSVVLTVYLIFHEQINRLTELNTPITLLMFLELYLTPAITFWTIRQRYEYHYKSVVAVTVSISLSNALLGIAFVLFSGLDRGIARILSCILVQCCFGVAIFAINIYKGKVFFSWQYAKYAILFNIPLMPHYLSTFILEQSDRIMIQKMVSFSAAGIYSVAYSAGMVMKIITSSATNAIIPWQYERLDKGEYVKLESVLKPILLIVSVLLGAFITVAPEIMKLLASKEYYEAVYCIPPVTTSIFFVFLYSVYNNIEFYFEENKYTMFIAMLGAGINILLNYILIRIFGYVAAAYTTLVCYIVFTALHSLYVQKTAQRVIKRKLLPASQLLWIIIPFVVFSIIMSFLYRFMILRYCIVLIIILEVFFRKRQIKDILYNVKNDLD